MTSKMLVGRDSLEEGDFPFEPTKCNRCADTICWSLASCLVRPAGFQGFQPADSSARCRCYRIAPFTETTSYNCWRARFLAATSGSIANARLLEFIVTAVYLSRRSLYKGG